MIHDAVLNYYGRRLATCSSDKTIKIFEVEGDSHRLVETLRGHESAVWCVAWAHPKYGEILASCSYDGKVCIWREIGGQWYDDLPQSPRLPLCMYVFPGGSADSLGPITGRNCST